MINPERKYTFGDPKNKSQFFIENDNVTILPVVDDGMTKEEKKAKIEEEKIKLQASQDEKKIKEKIKRNKNVLIYVAVAVAGFFAYKKLFKK